MRHALALIPVFAFAVISSGLGLSLRGDPRRLPDGLIDRPPPVFALAALDGEGRGLSDRDLAGKVALLNVFASWCPYCRAEHPTLLRLAQSGVVPIYGINWKDEPGRGARWLAANANPYALIGYDGNGRVGSDLGVTGVPETLVIDRTGRIRYHHIGPVSDEVWRGTFAPLVAELRSQR